MKHSNLLIWSNRKSDFNFGPFFVPLRVWVTLLSKLMAVFVSFLQDAKFLGKTRQSDFPECTQKTEVYSMTPQSDIQYVLHNLLGVTGYCNGTNLIGQLEQSAGFKFKRYKIWL